jgi:hypothetical protein
MSMTSDKVTMICHIFLLIKSGSRSDYCVAATNELTGLCPFSARPRRLSLKIQMDAPAQRHPPRRLLLYQEQKHLPHHSFPKTGEVRLLFSVSSAPDPPLDLTTPTNRTTDPPATRTSDPIGISDQGLQDGQA